MDNQPEYTLEDQAVDIAKDLKKCLNNKSVSNRKKYDYYNADQDTRDFGISTPIRLSALEPGIGWASRAVNTLSDRVVFDGFAQDTFGINDLFQELNAWATLNKVKHDAFIAGCAFVGVSSDGNGGSTLVPFTAEEATGEIDTKTGLLKYGLAVTRWVLPKIKTRGYSYDPVDYIVFTPQYTAIFVSNELVQFIPNPTGRTLLHPITHRATADQPLGKSRLTKTARRIIQEVGRLKRREEIAEEFYALPQRYITGLASGAKKDPSMDSAIGKVWAITKDEDGDSPTVGQLQQMSIEGFVEAKKDKARDFCAETGLTLRNLGYETGNPSSPESLAAMSDDLLLEATNSQVEMGEQFKQLAITLRMSIDQTNIIPTAIRSLVPAWKPIFQVDLGAAGDAIFKLFEVMPELRGTIAGYRMLGIGIREAEDLASRRQSLGAASFMQNGGA